MYQRVSGIGSALLGRVVQQDLPGVSKQEEVKSVIMLRLFASFS